MQNVENSVVARDYLDNCGCGWESEWYYGDGIEESEPDEEEYYVD